MPLQPGDTALVTGASSGIGAATVRALSAEGLAVHAAARRLDRLEALAADTGCTPVELDVRDREAVAAFGESTPVDVLVNNAGLGRAIGSLATASIDDIERTIDTNVTALIHVTRAVLPGMIERRNGHIVNISSVLALYPGPAALYGASKGAVRKFSRDLRLELQGTGVRVTEIAPGRVSTEFYDVAVDDQARREAIKHTGIAELTPDDVAASIVHALKAPWHVNIAHLELAPTEQTYGGSQLIPVDRDPS